MRARSVFLLTLVLAGALAVLTPESALNPGTLVRGHADLAGACLSCHSPFRGTPATRCAACHAMDSIGITRRVRPAGWEPRQGLPGLHRAVQATDCSACHTDHAGRDPARATRPFAHDALPAADRVRCGACHEGDRPADGLHANAAANCADCHTTRAWSPADFAHERYFVLDRDHNVRCATCHDQPTSYRAYTCYGCHAHTPGNVLAQHREEGIRNLNDCVRCHRSASGGEGREGGGD